MFAYDLVSAVRAVKGLRRSRGLAIFALIGSWMLVLRGDVAVHD